MATFWSAGGKMRSSLSILFEVLPAKCVKLREKFARCKIRKTFRKDGYQQYWFLNNLVKLHSVIEAV